MSIVGGARIVLSDIGQAADASTPSKMVGSRDGLAAVAEGMRASCGSGRVSTLACDVRCPDEVQALVEFAVAEHGSLDIWINNARIGYLMKPLLDVTSEDWNAVIAVSLSGAFVGLQATARMMVAQGRGARIVNSASQAAKPGFPTRSDAAGYIPAESLNVSGGEEPH